MTTEPSREILVAKWILNWSWRSYCGPNTSFSLEWCEKKEIPRLEIYPKGKIDYNHGQKKEKKKKDSSSHSSKSFHPKHFLLNLKKGGEGASV